MNKKWLRVVSILTVCAILAAVLAGCGKKNENEEAVTGEEPLSLTDLHFTDKPGSVKKSETVYVNLNPDGSVRKILVSDWLHADRANVAVDDKTTVKNISVTKGKASKADSNGDLVWQMETSDVYYQGDGTTQLPLDVQYEYTLDGAPIAPAELAGKSGKLSITVRVKNNITKTVKIDGEDVTLYTPMLSAGVMILPYEHFTDITVEGGLNVGSGTNEIVLMVGMPGMSESLGLADTDGVTLPDTFTITANVTEFTLGDCYMVGVPLTSVNLDLALPKTIEDARDVLGKLSNMSGLLGSIDPDGVLASYLTDSQAAADLLNNLKKAVDLYDSNKELIGALSQFITPENMEKLSALVDSLNNDQTKQLLNLLSNVPALKTLLGTLSGMSDQLADVQPILDGISKALEDPKVASELENLPQTIETLNELTSYLKENEEAISIVTQLLQADETKDLTGALDELIGNLDVSAGENASGSDVTSKALVERMSQWMQFDYPLYTAAADGMETSCMLIYKTDPVH